MKINIIFIGAVAIFSSACAAHSVEKSAGLSKELSDSEIKELIRKNGIDDVWAVSQVAQGMNNISLFLKMNRRSVKGNICLTDFKVLDLIEKDSLWSIKGIESGISLSLLPCKDALEENFASVNIGSDIDTTIKFASDLNNFIDSKIGNDIKVDFSDDRLKRFIRSSIERDLVFIGLAPGGDYIGEFAVKGLMPSFLSINMRYVGGRLVTVHVNDDNGVDPVNK